MSDSPSNEVILEKLSNLKDVTKSGFDSLNERAKEANHGIKKNTEWRVEVKPLIESLLKESKDNTEHTIQARTTISIFKWLFGVLGLGNIVLILKMFS